MSVRYQTLKAFYPYYLTEHQNVTSRILHFIGTSLFILTTTFCIINSNFSKFIIGPLMAYSFAWAGHYFFEKNKPATFKYPLFSLASDFIMLFHFITGQLNTRIKQAFEEKINK